MANKKAKPRPKRLSRGRKRQGELGRILNVTDRCYAATVIGGCSAEFSEEHPLSKALRRDKNLKVEVTTLAEGRAPRRILAKELPIAQLSARVLCIAHNNGLSDADAEAVKLSDALREAKARRNSLVVRPFLTVQIDGKLFGRWLCKYVAGWRAAFAEPVDADFIRYAFARPTQRRIHILFPVRVGAQPDIGDTSNLPLQTFLTTDGAPEAYLVRFEGLDVIVSNARADDPQLANMRAAFPQGTIFMDRMVNLNMPTDQMRISFGWDDDDDHARILDGHGRPVPRR